MPGIARSCNRKCVAGRRKLAARARPARRHRGFALSERRRSSISSSSVSGTAAPAVAQKFAKATVLVDQAIEVEHQLVAQRADGLLRQAAAAYVYVAPSI